MFSTEEELKTLTGIIYAIINNKNNKIYIGVTDRTFNERYQRKTNKLNDISNKYFERAIKKTGVANFSILIIDSNKTTEELNELEIMYIRLFNSNDKDYGYNLTIGGNRPVQNTWQHFIKRAREKHKEKFEYPEPKNVVTYNTILKIYCKMCNKFFNQRAGIHLRSKGGCKKCSMSLTPEKRESEKIKFIKKSTKLHENKFDYSIFNFINYTTKGNIICRKCNFIFPQTPSIHLEGRGCRKCANKKTGLIMKHSINEFILKLQTIHGFRFIFDINKYKTLKDKIEFGCLDCGAITETSPEQILKNTKMCCKRTGYKRPNLFKTNIPKDIFENQVLKKFGEHYNVTDYTQLGNEVKIHCKECWRDFKVSSGRDLLTRKSSLCECYNIITKDDLSKNLKPKPPNPQNSPIIDLDYESSLAGRRM